VGRRLAGDTWITIWQINYQYLDNSAKNSDQHDHPRGLQIQNITK
jgi:hypothetical protein